MKINQDKKTDWTIPNTMLKDGEMAKLRIWSDSIKHSVEMYGAEWMRADSLSRIPMRL